MRHLMLLLLLCCLAPFARAQADDALLQNVLAELGRHAAVRADFTQTRSNPALDKPQASEGRLLFVLGHGMLWQTTAPYQETLAFTGSRSARIDTQGHAQPMRNERGVGQISQMLQSMLAGRLDEVLRQFDVVASGTPTQWTLRFTPKQASVASVLDRIELDGDAYLEGIHITMHDGASTQIRFTDAHDAGPLSALEQHALSRP
jgi:outer membrane lipoprotein-sorting protein